MSRWRRLAPLLGVALFAVAALVLQRELAAVQYDELRRTLAALPRPALAAALALTALNYALLCGFDLLAFRYVGKAMPRWKVAIASFTGYAVSNSVGFALISGTSVRWRFYSRWGLTAAEIGRVVVFYFGTFWLGLLVLGGGALALDPHPGLAAAVGPWAARGAGVLLLGIAAAYGVAALVRRKPLRLRRMELPLPDGRTVALQFLLSTVDWALAGAVFWVLVPATPLTFPEFLGAFLGAQLLGVISHLPGGVGVFEGTMAVLLGPYLSPSELLATLVLYRLVYYVVPLAAALLVLLADEIRQRRHQLARWGGAFGQLTMQLAPKVLAAFVFLAGAVLLVSGATPGSGGRVEALARWLPLAVLETSYFIGSVAGVGLLIVSNGVARRLDMGLHLALVLLGVGIAASLLKGGDYEEAVLLALLAGALVAGRDAFDRKAEFWAARFSPGFVAAVVAVVGASIWLGFFAFSHVEYGDELWWRFAVDEEKPRFLRASVGAMVAILGFGVFRLLRPAPPEVPPPTDEDYAAVERILATHPSTMPFLAYLGDKALLFDGAREAFLMYAVQGRTWVALGDPVGRSAAAVGLIRAFIERCDDFGGVPVFYQVTKDRLHRYADFGLTFAKLGEEAHVALPGFGLDGAERKPFRLVMNRFARAGLRFRVAPAEEVPALLPALRAVSGDWLKQKSGGEKGFSLGFFDDAYVRRFPVAVVESERGVEAFATVWPGADGTELSVDLMRYRGDAPKNVMEALLLHLMLWGKEAGYRRFNLGMAPLSGLEMSSIAPVWTRIGTFLFERGQALYNFQGLRVYKEKFHPAWEPRYLAYPGGLNLPRITADVSALIAGGYRRIFRRRGGR